MNNGLYIKVDKFKKNVFPDNEIVFAVILLAFVIFVIYETVFKMAKEFQINFVT